MENIQDMILVLDFGSQYNQLITRRIREFGVYSELHPHTLSIEDIKKMNPKGIILSGVQTAYMTKSLFAATSGFLNSGFQCSEFAMACN